MRDIKFRAWNKEEKRMIENASNLLLFQDWFCEASPEYLEARKVYELMQYTGLKDKNGKEIFENDIVNVKYKDGSGYDNPVEVSFEKGSFWVGMGYLNDIKIIEVIGNVWENPELLKEGK